MALVALLAGRARVRAARCARKAARRPSCPSRQTSYHVPVFSNELVTVLNVFIPPQRDSGYHRHSLDTDRAC